MVARSMAVLDARTALALGLAAAALAAAGCGDSAKIRNDKNQIRQVVTQFSQSSDARACDLLTDTALQRVYGGFTAPVAKSKANCVAASKRFKGAPIKVNQLNFLNDTLVKAGTLSADGKIAYTVTLRKNGPRWRIDQITQGKAQP
jgi:Flp pilus assembly protein TadG